MADEEQFPGESPNLDFELFDFHGLGIEPYEDAILSNTERQQLRVLAEPGGPLYRIMSGLLDYKKKVDGSFSQVDLHSPSGLQMVASLQAESKAIKWQYEMWQRLLTFVEPETPNGDEDQSDD